MQADVKNAEGDVINHLLTQISADDFKFDTLAAKVISKSNYVLLGSEYEADIFVAAFSTTQNPSIWLGDVDTVSYKIKGGIDSTSVKVERGVGKLIEKPSAEGEKKYSGIVRVKSPAGLIKEYPFNSSYIAAKPNLVVSADKMNVLYIGVDNPMSISVPGVPAEKVEASLSGGGSLSKKGKGAFIARVSSPGKVNINVRAEINGVKQSMGKPVEFRVKRVPDPVAKVGGKSSGPMSKAVLNAQGGVIPVLENFDFDLNFTVFEFDMVIAGKGRDIMTSKSRSNVITAEMKELIGRTRLGDKVFFENIKAKGPDGTTRNLNAISFTIQ
jgi:gliding motility-associated protein GldM